MEEENSEIGGFLQALADQLGIGLDSLPSLLAAGLLLAFGWVIASLARRAVRSLALESNRLLERAFSDGALSTVRVSSVTAAIFGEVVFWVALLLFVVLAARVAGPSALFEWLDRITVHLPNLFAGAAIVVVGYLISVYAREQIAPQTATTSEQSRRPGVLAQLSIIAVTVIVGLDQIGIDVALLVALAVVFFATIMLGLAAAVALGARSHVSNLIGVRAGREHLNLGSRVRLANVEGEVLEITSGHIVLNTADGKTLIPGKYVNDDATVIVAPNVSGGTGR